ncbi:hypothetical protein [Rugamonas sp. DEMB1]|uniref:hypothetical protein n=1 Tax=Rugamonas sp. DEMB1 TaxID=3039386 RepID=UPI00244B868A|nr:hypothetical protein [Rugamonas sp. DEMB1]WGG49730.1 hypothetical protein QC826_24945 [Rugamonas sp. DEMB1]
MRRAKLRQAQPALPALYRRRHEVRYGIARKQAALERDCDRLRLEIRHDNLASLCLFQHRGYRIFDQYADYYEDGMAAHRLEKPLTRKR